jgi:hypothetical protein
MMCPTLLKYHCFKVDKVKRTFTSMCEGFKRYPWLFSLRNNMTELKKYVKKGRCAPKPIPCAKQTSSDLGGPVCAMREYSNDCKSKLLK